MEKTLIYMEEDILAKSIERVVRNVIQEEFQAEKEKIYPTLTINEVAKMLKRSHKTIKKMVESEIFPLTPDGKILRSDVNKYLGIDQ